MFFIFVPKLLKQKRVCGKLNVMESVKITRLSRQKRRKNRVSLYTENGYFCSLADEIVVRAGIRPGTEITSERLAELQAEDEYERAKDAAASYLEYAPRTCRQVMDHLVIKKELSKEAAEKACSLMQHYGYVDDEAYALELSKSLTRRYARRVIVQRLVQKGLPEDIAKRAAEEATPDEYAQAYDVLLSIEHKFRDEDSDKRRRMLMSALVRRGFAYDAVKCAVDKLESESE